MLTDPIDAVQRAQDMANIMQEKVCVTYSLRGYRIKTLAEAKKQGYLRQVAEICSPVRGR